MRDNDSYPPVDGITSENTAKEADFSLNETEENIDETLNEDSDESRGPEVWDGSEAEIVVDDEAEDYEEESTGIKIKYKLKPNEVRSFIHNSADFEKNKKSQKKHTFIQCLLFTAMVLLGFVSANKYYWFLALFPLIAILLIWVLPYIAVKKLAIDILKSDEFSVEVFPDKIEVTCFGKVREIPLDGSCESEEFEGLILIFSNSALSLIIPMRSIEPEFKADVQAMILAGTKPKYAG